MRRRRKRIPTPISSAFVNAGVFFENKKFTVFETVFNRLAKRGPLDCKYEYIPSSILIGHKRRFKSTLKTLRFNLNDGESNNFFVIS